MAYKLDLLRKLLFNHDIFHMFIIKREFMGTFILIMFGDGVVAQVSKGPRRKRREQSLI